jgi:hypothetical protein
MRDVETMVRQEVLLCLSGLVHTLASADGAIENRRHGSNAKEAADLMEQAPELSYPVQDWEGAAEEAGWYRTSATDPTYWRNNSAEADGYAYHTAQEACEAFEIEPHDRDVYEHWAVTEWLADQLEAQGEKVDRDFAGLIVWARTTTGQAISMDSVIEAVHAAAKARYEAAAT